MWSPFIHCPNYQMQFIIDNIKPLELQQKSASSDPKMSEIRIPPAVLIIQQKSHQINAPFQYNMEVTHIHNVQ